VPIPSMFCWGLAIERKGNVRDLKWRVQNQGNSVPPAMISDALSPAVPPTGSQPQAPTISLDMGADDGLASIWAAVPIVAIVFATATLYRG
jgi:hypothetical protein